MRETKRVTESVSEKQFRGRKNHVGLLDAEDRLSVKLRGAPHAGLHMNNAFRCAGGAGGIKPKTRIVSARRRGDKVAAGFRHQVRQEVMAGAFFSRYDHMFQKRLISKNRLEDR